MRARRRLLIVVVVLTWLVPIAFMLYHWADYREYVEAKRIAEGVRDAFSGEPDRMVAGLRSRDKVVLLTSLHQLRVHRNPVGETEAGELILSDDEEIRRAAARYLVALGPDHAVPYLIRGLSKLDPADVAWLESLTGEDFGRDQARWIAWWRHHNPECHFDFRASR